MQVKVQVNLHSGNCLQGHTMEYYTTPLSTHTHTHMRAHTDTHTPHTLNFNPHNYPRYYDQMNNNMLVTDGEQEPKTVVVSDTGSAKTTQPVFPQTPLPSECTG